MYLTLENITKKFPPRGGVTEVTAVNDISLEIQKGELVTLLGPSGCGKTTTLRMIAGFEFPTTGKIILDGVSINSLPPHKRDMSMVFQSYAIFPHLTVFENIAYGLNVQKLPKEVITKRVDKVLDLVHLEGYGHRAPNQLSGGQQQRVALARALIMEPKVLLMDEPLSNLDAKLREEMRTEIRRIQQTLNITSVYVTHDQIEAMTLSDKIVVMNQGIIEQIGTPVEVYRYPNSRFVANFIGRANFLPGVVESKERTKLRISSLGKVLDVATTTREFTNGEKVTLIVRPEIVQVHKEKGTYPGIVKRSVYLGDVIEYEVDVIGTMITGIETDPYQMEIIPENSKVFISFAENYIQVLPRRQIMREIDVLMIGNFAKDKIIIDGVEETASGSGVYFGSVVFSRLGLKLAVATRLHPDDFFRLDELNQGIEVFATPAEGTSGIANYYTSSDMERRICKPIGFGGKFSLREIPELMPE